MNTPLMRKHSEIQYASRNILSVRFGYLLSLIAGMIWHSQLAAAEPRVEVRDGLKLYSQSEFEAAREKFAAASEQLSQEKSAEAAIAAFDEACASHRKGDVEKARDAYLRAGLSQDRSISVAAHFNLGNLTAEKAKILAGEHPEAVAPDKRSEIVDQLKQAITAYRHCLELQPDHTQARRNLELVRLWIKYYTDKWNEADRQKRRDESNLLVFLEYLIQTQSLLRENTLHQQSPLRADTVAELKRLQDELKDEIPTLKEKLDAELRPQTAPGNTAGKTPGTATQATTPPANSKELEEGIALLKSWADMATQNMQAASARLSEKELASAANAQQAAINELDKIWDAVVPFQPLLSRNLTDQTAISKTLAPGSTAEDSGPAGSPSTGSTATEKNAGPAADSKTSPQSAEPESNTKTNSPESKPKDEAQTTDGKEQKLVKILPTEPTDSKTALNSTGKNPVNAVQLESKDEALTEVLEKQEKTLRKTRLLAPKAAAELQRLEATPPLEPMPPANPPNSTTKPDAQPQPDPAQMKAAYQKAIELAPKAVEQMEGAVKSIQQKDRITAAKHAEEARKILEEIQKSQPRDQQQNQDQQQKDQQKDQNQDQQQQDQQNDKQKSQDQKDQEKKEQDQKDRDQKDKDQQDQQQDKQDDQKQKDKQDPQQQKQDQQKSDQQDKQGQPPKQPGQISQDRIEEALRKVRERQQAKRERDRKLKGQVLGRTPVDKDW